MWMHPLHFRVWLCFYYVEPAERQKEEFPFFSPYTFAGLHLKKGDFLNYCKLEQALKKQKVIKYNMWNSFLMFSAKGWWQIISNQSVIIENVYFL